jgi:hypothetical protein
MFADTERFSFDTQTTLRNSVAWTGPLAGCGTYIHKYVHDRTDKNTPSRSRIPYNPLLRLSTWNLSTTFNEDRDMHYMSGKLELRSPRS